MVLTVSDYPWWRSVDSLPDHPKNIRVYYRDRVEEEDAENITDALLSVHKPEFQSFPNPDPSFENWLEWGWNDYRYKTRIKELILLPLDQMRLPEEPSDDDRERIDELNHTYKEFFTDMLRAIRVTIDHDVDRIPDKKGYYILQPNYTTHLLKRYFFKPSELERANACYDYLEQHKGDQLLDIVLVRAASYETVKAAYPNYFLDIGEFIRIVEDYLK